MLREAGPCRIAGNGTDRSFYAYFLLRCKHGFGFLPQISRHGNANHVQCAEWRNRRICVHDPRDAFFLDGTAAIEQVTLIQLKDAKTLNELLSEPEVRALVRPFVPDPGRALALVAAEDVDELVQVLARYGVSTHDRLSQASLQPKAGTPAGAPPETS